MIYFLSKKRPMPSNEFLKAVDDDVVNDDNMYT